MLGRRLSVALIAAAMGLGASAPGFTQPAPIVTANMPARRKKGLFNGRVAPSMFAYGHSYTKKERTTMAQQKRASVKAKNRARNKGHHHG